MKALRPQLPDESTLKEAVSRPPIALTARVTVVDCIAGRIQLCHGNIQSSGGSGNVKLKTTSLLISRMGIHAGQ